MSLHTEQTLKQRLFHMKWAQQRGVVPHKKFVEQNIWNKVCCTRFVEQILCNKPCSKCLVEQFFFHKICCTTLVEPMTWNQRCSTHSVDFVEQRGTTCGTMWNNMSKKGGTIWNNLCNNVEQGVQQCGTACGTMWNNVWNNVEQRVEQGETTCATMWNNEWDNVQNHPMLLRFSCPLCTGRVVPQVVSH